MICYLAHPIDYDYDGVAHRMADGVASMAREMGVNLYWPKEAFHIPHPDEETGVVIGQVNDHTQPLCDAVVAILPKGVYTVGTIVEIQRAAKRRQPLAILTDWDPAGIVTVDYDGDLPVPAGQFVRYFPVSAVGTREALHWVQRQIRREYDGEERAGRLEPLRDEFYAALDRAANTKSAPLDLPFIGVSDGSDRGWTTDTPVMRSYPDDAGLDLLVQGDHTIDPHSFVDIPSGIAVAIPPTHWGYLVGRSSTLRRRGLLVNPGVVDPGYRGELFSGVWNLTGLPVTVKDGERVAQLILIPNGTAGFNPVWTDSLPGHPRGGNGFGSTGE